jgi:hypothetical protein
MSRNSAIPIPILKIDQTTKEIKATYNKIKDIRECEGITYTRLRRLVCSGDAYKGFIYKCTQPIPEGIYNWLHKKKPDESSYVPHWESMQLWEGDDGMFDIDGWLKSC